MTQSLLSFWPIKKSGCKTIKAYKRHTHSTLGNVYVFVIYQYIVNTKYIFYCCIYKMRPIYIYVYIIIKILITVDRLFYW